MLLFVFVITLIISAIWLLTPNKELSILNAEQHPEKGSLWEVKFATKGSADLTISPSNESTLNELEFIELRCDNKRIDVNPTKTGELFISNWKCNQTATIVHKLKKAGNHTLTFTFGKLQSFAYNSTNSVSDSYSDESKIGSKVNSVVSSGQIKLDTQCEISGVAQTTDWGDGSLNCPAGSSSDPNRCYDGECVNCGGTGFEGQCFYLGDWAQDCSSVCTDKGGCTYGMIDQYSHDWYTLGKLWYPAAGYLTSTYPNDPMYDPWAESCAYVQSVNKIYTRNRGGLVNGCFVVQSGMRGICACEK